jgi:predicted  nucleic acid-binding Zn-ribbon protein
MDQDEYDDLLRRLTALVVKLDERDDEIMERLEEQREFNRQQVAINDRLTAAIERLDVTLAAIKDLLGRGNGH